MKKIAIGVCLLFLLAGNALATDCDPVERKLYGTNALSWTLATDQAATGDSCRATNVRYCRGPKKLIITTAGATVNQSFTLTDDGKVITTIDGAAIASVTAETLIYSTDANVDTLKVTSTITDGTVTITLRCN